MLYIRCIFPLILFLACSLLDCELQEIRRLDINGSPLLEMVSGIEYLLKKKKKSKEEGNQQIHFAHLVDARCWDCGDPHHGPCLQQPPSL